MRLLTITSVFSCTFSPCSEHVLFVVKAKQFALGRDDETERWLMACHIYERFLKTDSPMEVNIESSLRKLYFKEKFPGNSQFHPGNDIFNPALQSVLHLMAHDSMRRYLCKT